MNRINTITILIAITLVISACLGAQETGIAPTSTSILTPPDLPPVSPSETNAPSPFPGLTITYILDGNAWLWDGITPNRQLSNDGEATRVIISDDGKIIAYQRGQSLWVVNPTGSFPQMLVDIPAYGAPILPERGAGLTLFINQFEFQPNTHWIYFTTAWGGNKPGIQSRDLHRIQVDDPMPQAVLTQDGGSITFSDDGILLALASETNIKVAHADGSTLLTALSYPVISNKTDYIPQVVWISDGSGFYTVLPNDTGGKSKYLFVSSEGLFSAQLSEFDGSIPLISPDGLKVAYVEQTASGFSLHIVEASNVDTTIATYENAPMLIPWHWSPDSNYVVFSNAHPVLLLTAGIGIPAFPLTESVSPNSLRWIDNDHFIFFREGKLLIGEINNPDTILIASGFLKDGENINSYDFAIHPTP